MNNLIITQFARFVSLLLFQVLILNQVEINGLLTPYIYIMAIMMLPFDTPMWLVLSAAFVAGISVDLFSNTIGMHAAAAVLIAYTRQYAIAYNATVGSDEFVNYPNLSNMGFVWFFTYATILSIIYHFVFFTIEIFSFYFLGYIILKTLCSSALALLIMLIYQYIFEPKY
ncbi:MAG: rod shape-determining protein MreD [Sphingobacteriales bacterium]|nr:rod shape-determining protein MreD [Sphingobacteriales bacterium]